MKLSHHSHRGLRASRKSTRLPTGLSLILLMSPIRLSACVASCLFPLHACGCPYPLPCSLSQRLHAGLPLVRPCLFMHFLDGLFLECQVFRAPSTEIVQGRWPSPPCMVASVTSEAQVLEACPEQGWLWTRLHRPCLAFLSGLTIRLCCDCKCGPLEPFILPAGFLPVGGAHAQEGLSKRLTPVLVCVLFVKYQVGCASPSLMWTSAAGRDVFGSLEQIFLVTTRGSFFGIQPSV